MFHAANQVLVIRIVGSKTVGPARVAGIDRGFLLPYSGFQPCARCPVFSGRPSVAPWFPISTYFTKTTRKIEMARAVVVSTA